MVAVIAGPATETGLGTEIRVSLRTGDVLAKAPNSRDRLLLAGLGPLRSATRSGEGEVLLETLSGERWLVRMSPVSGLVAAVEPATSPPPAPRRSDRCVTVM
ncbi:hypothetical protein GCM10025331_53630 [Actinoplanes utahensis]|nr:hypothetical protein Aut01nite_61220 [Actinoplanes utahensis]